MTDGIPFFAVVVRDGGGVMTDEWLRGVRRGEEQDLPYCATFGKVTIQIH